MNKERILFMGTPEFAAYALEALIENNFNVVGVVTAVDKPAGRGMKMRESAVKKVAQKYHLPVLQPPNLKSDFFLTALRSFEATIQVVVAFRMLPKAVWSMPSKGTFNLHASLLPEYRGAAPINWAIINGEKTTGVTTFFIDEKIDTGEIIAQEEVAIEENETAGSLHDKLVILGSHLIQDTIHRIAAGEVTTIKQPKDIDPSKHAPKLYKDTCCINWEDSSLKIDQFIRGLSPYPGAWTTLHQNNTSYTVKIFAAKGILEAHQHETGTVVADKNSLKIYASDGFLEIYELQLQGKRKMSTKDLLNGFRLTDDAKML